MSFILLLVSILSFLLMATTFFLLELLLFLLFFITDPTLYPGVVVVVLLFCCWAFLPYFTAAGFDGISAVCKGGTSTSSPGLRLLSSGGAGTFTGPINNCLLRTRTRVGLLRQFRTPPTVPAPPPPPFKYY